MINTYVKKFETKYVFNIGFNVQRTRFRERCWREMRYRGENLVENSVNEGYRERRLEIALNRQTLPVDSHIPWRHAWFILLTRMEKVDGSWQVKTTDTCAKVSFIVRLFP
jgi:hypothetical protein